MPTLHGGLKEFYTPEVVKADTEALARVCLKRGWLAGTYAGWCSCRARGKIWLARSGGDMESIGIYEAKSKLSELVERAESGREVVITRHGKPVAKIVPAQAEQAIDRAALFREIKALRRTIRLKKPLSLREIREAIEWGRR